MPILFIQRQRVLLMEVFKIYNKQGPLYLHDLLLQTGNEKSLRNNYSLVQPKCFSSTYGLNSFSYNGARLWNNLSNDFKRTSNVKTFKMHLGKWHGLPCACSYCIMCILRRL